MKSGLYRSQRNATLPRDFALAQPPERSAECLVLPLPWSGRAQRPAPAVSLSAYRRDSGWSCWPRAVLSQALIIDGILINDCIPGKPESRSVNWLRHAVTLRTVQGEASPGTVRRTAGSHQPCAVSRPSGSTQRFGLRALNRSAGSTQVYGWVWKKPSENCPTQQFCLL